MVSGQRCPTVNLCPVVKAFEDDILYEPQQGDVQDWLVPSGMG
jgi:hypothetical protein